MSGILRKFYEGETQIDFIGKRKIWFLISAVLVLVCLGAIAGRSAPSSCAPPLPGFFRGLSCGIEFKGGISVEAPIQDSSDLAELSELEIIAEVRDALVPAGAERAASSCRPAPSATSNPRKRSPTSCGGSPVLRSGTAQRSASGGAGVAR
jgi:preprotein translocase subunit SecF